MKSLNSALFPPSGYYFTESDGVKFEAASLDALVALVGGYRVRNAMPFGDPRQEIIDQICQRHPEVCVDGGPQPSTTTRELVKRVVRWIAGLAGRRHPTVDPDVAYSRASVCAACKHLQPWKEFCRPCEAKYIPALAASIKPKELIPKLEGKACALAGDDVSAAAWLKNPAPVTGAPGACWRADKVENADT